MKSVSPHILWYPARRHVRPRAIIALIMRSQILRAHRLLAATNKMMNRLKLTLYYG